MPKDYENSAADMRGILCLNRERESLNSCVSLRVYTFIEDNKRFVEIRGMIMKKVLGIIVSCIFILAGCLVQNSPLKDSNMSAQNSSQKDENSMKDAQKWIDIPGYVTIDGVLACAEAWLKKEEGLTPFSDMQEDELLWLSMPFMSQYVKRNGLKGLITEMSLL